MASLPETSVTLPVHFIHFQSLLSISGIWWSHGKDKEEREKRDERSEERETDKEETDRIWKGLDSSHPVSGIAVNLSFSFRTPSISEMNRYDRKDMTKEWTDSGWKRLNGGESNLSLFFYFLHLTLDSGND